MPPKRRRAGSLVKGTVTVGGKKVPAKNLRAAYMKVFDNAVIPAISGQIYKQAQEYVDEMKFTIHSQRYNWKALSEKYADWKRKRSKIPNSGVVPPQPVILIKSGKYVDSIQTWRGRYNQVFIGLKGTTKDETEALQTLAIWLERGTRTTPTHAGMPPRPHWSLVLSAMRRRQHTTKKELGKILYKHLQTLRKTQ